MIQIIKNWFKPKPTTKELLSDVIFNAQKVIDSYSDVTTIIAGNERFLVSGDVTSTLLITINTLNSGELFSINTTDGRTYIKKKSEFQQATYYPKKEEFDVNKLLTNSKNQTK